MKTHILATFIAAVGLCPTVNASTQVTIDTPDEALLAGKDTDTMYQVAKPSVRLHVSVNDKTPLAVKTQDDVLHLHGEVRSQKDISRIEQTLGKVFDQDINTDNLTVSN